jgi:hypothetical protein
MGTWSGGCDLGWNGSLVERRHQQPDRHWPQDLALYRESYSQKNDSRAWIAILKYFNRTHGRGHAGYLGQGFKLIQEKADGAHWTWLTRGVRFAASSSQDNLPLAGFSNSQLVQRAIENQPLHYRKALLLCEVEEMPYQEICGNIGDPDRERYVAPAPSAEVRSRVTP